MYYFTSKTALHISHLIISRFYRTHTPRSSNDEEHYGAAGGNKFSSVQDIATSNTDEHAQLDHFVEHDGLSSTALKTGYPFDNKPDYVYRQDNAWHRDYRKKLFGIRLLTVRADSIRPCTTLRLTICEPWDERFVPSILGEEFTLLVLITTELDRGKTTSKDVTSAILPLALLLRLIFLLLDAIVSFFTRWSAVRSIQKQEF